METKLAYISILCIAVTIVAARTLIGDLNFLGYMIFGGVGGALGALTSFLFKRSIGKGEKQVSAIQNTDISKIEESVLQTKKINIGKNERKMNFKKTRVILISLILAVAILVHTNPTHQDYNNWTMMNKFAPEAWDKDTINIAVLTHDKFSIRRDYFIFSTYELKLTTKDQDAQIHYAFIGFFNHIFTIPIPHTTESS